MATFDPFYTTGTVSVANGGTTVTGVGTAFNTAGIRAGDLFISSTFGGWAVVTADPTSATSLAITAWPGTTLSAGSSYRVWRISDADRVIAASAAFMQSLVPNLTAFGQLSGQANKAPYFTGAGAVALADQTDFGRSLQAITGANGKIPVATAAGTVAMRDIKGTVSQSSGVPTGALVERGSNANGEYVRFADGTQICWTRISVAVTTGVALVVGPSMSFPSAFSVAPSVSCFVARPTDGSGTYRVSSETYLGTYPTTVVWRVNVFETTGVNFNAAVTYFVDMVAIGRWF